MKEEFTHRNNDFSYIFWCFTKKWEKVWVKGAYSFAYTHKTYLISASLKVVWANVLLNECYTQSCENLRRRSLGHEASSAEA